MMIFETLNTQGCRGKLIKIAHFYKHIVLMCYRTTKLSSYIRGRKCSEAWKFINKVKTNAKWVKHFTTLLTEHRPEYRQQADEQADIQLEGEVVQKDATTVKNTIKQLKNRKSWVLVV